MRRTALALIAALAVAGNLVAQERQGADKPQEPTRQTQQGAKTPPMTRSQIQLQNMAQHTEQLALQIRETNQWMEQKQVREEYRLLGQNLEQSCDQLRQMIRQAQQLRDQVRTQDLKQDRDRLQQLDRLQDHLRDMDRDMTRAHDALEKMVGKT